MQAPERLGQMRTRWILLLAVFGVGVATGHGLPREASAQTAHAPVAILDVPASGLMFRAPDGTLIALLSHDARGGFLQVVNGDGRSTTRIPEDYRPGPGF
jgi:hypothetical protein